MTRKSLAIASVLVVLAMAAAALIVGSSLPDGVQLPSHWGLDGRPDRFTDKWSALLMPVAITAGLSLLFHFLPELETRREGLARSRGLYLWAWAGLLLIMAIVEVAVVSVALGWGLPVGRLIMAGVGAMLLMISNQLGKSRSMYLIGIRTPWTLASEEVWIKTHRLGGKMMVLAGLIMIAAALLPLPSPLPGTVAIAAVALAALVPVVYSYLLWRRERRQGLDESGA